MFIFKSKYNGISVNQLYCIPQYTHSIKILWYIKNLSEVLRDHFEIGKIFFCQTQHVAKKNVKNEFYSTKVRASRQSSFLSCFKTCFICVLYVYASSHCKEENLKHKSFSAVHSPKRATFSSCSCPWLLFNSVYSFFLRRLHC